MKRKSKLPRQPAQYLMLTYSETYMDGCRREPTILGCWTLPEEPEARQRVYDKVYDLTDKLVGAATLYGTLRVKVLGAKGAEVKGMGYSRSLMPSWGPVRAVMYYYRKRRSQKARRRSGGQRPLARVRR